MIYLVTKDQEIFDSDIYKIITVKDSLDLLSTIKVVGLDSETEGLDPWTNKLKSIQLGNKDFQVVIDCTTVNPCLYKNYLESDDRVFLGWNLKFDLKFLYHVGIYPKKVYDGYLAEKLLWMGYPAGIHSMSLKSAAEHYIGVEMDKSVRGKIIYLGLTTEVIQYATRDVEFLQDIIELQYKELLKKGLEKAIKVENKFVLPLAYVEYCGIHLDVNKWKAKMNKDQKKLNETKSALDKWVTSHFPNDKRFTYVNLQGDLWDGFNTEPQCIINWDSPKQVQILLEMLGFNLEVKDKATGGTKKSIDAKVIKPQKDVSDIAPIYIAYKEASKVTSTYGQNVLDQINKASGRIHTNYSQLGADTTRVTSGGKGGKANYINLLNIPSDEETRACFTAENGNKWISIDYAGQESALLASIADDPLMLKELNEGSGDIHSLVASLVFKKEIGNTPLKEIKHKFHSLRQIAKGYEFLVAYGGNANTIMANYGKTEEEANQIYNAYMNGLTGVQKYQSFCRKDWFNKGYILLSPITGHKTFIYDWEELKEIKERMSEPGYWNEYRSKKTGGKFDDPQVQEVKHFFKRKSASEKQSINYRIQASGSMCLRFSLIYFFDYLRKNNLFNKVKICVIPYDEINCEAPANIAMEVADNLHKCMVKAGAIFCTRCKLDADISLNSDGNLPDHWVH